MRILLILTTFLTCIMGYSQTTEPVMYTLSIADKGENFWSMVIGNDNKLFMTKSLGDGGELIVINDYDSILHTKKFTAKGRASIDVNGSMGVYSGENKTFWIFNQSDLSIIDSVSIPSLQGELKVFFMLNKGILIGGVNGTYFYKDHKLKELKELTSYKVFDCHPTTGDLILGYWDSSIHSDVKINRIYHSNLAALNERTYLFSTQLYTVYAYYMSNGMKIVAVDGAHKVYRFDFLERTFNVVIDDKGLFSADKVSENEIAVVTTYRGTKEFKDMFFASSISLLDVSTGKISETFGIQKRPSAGTLMLNSTVGTIYFLSSGGVNEVVAIRK